MARKRKSEVEASGDVPVVELDNEKPKRKRRSKSETPGETNSSSDQARDGLPAQDDAPVKLRRRRSKQTESAPPAEPSEQTDTPQAPAPQRRERKRRGPAPRPRTPQGDIVPTGSSVCCICGRVHKSRSAEIQPVDIRFSIGTRTINLNGEYMCMDCITQLPNFLAGALHFAFNMPKDAFKRCFLYPPFELDMHDSHKKLPK